MTITLYAFGSNFGLPDPSPFVMKADLLLKLSGLSYQTNTDGDLMKAPKAKFPYIEDNGAVIADSSFIQKHIESKHQIDFDKHISEERKANLFFLCKYCEDNLYFLVMSNRWLNKENFEKGPKAFFARAPFFLRGIISSKVIKDIKNTLWLQGLGRHSQEEQVALVEEGFKNFSTVLGTEEYFGGAEPCSADATLFSFILSTSCDLFDSPYKHIIAQHPNLVAYSERMLKKFYPDFNIPEAMKAKQLAV